MTWNLYGLLVCLLLPTLAQAEIYQWRDEHGRLQFSDEPPDKKPAETVTLKPASGYSPPQVHRQVGKDVIRDSMRRSPRSDASKASIKAFRAASTRRAASAKASKESSCRRYRDRYRTSGVRPSRTASGARSQRDHKRYLRGKIKEYCH